MNNIFVFFVTWNDELLFIKFLCVALLYISLFLLGIAEMASVFCLFGTRFKKPSATAEGFLLFPKIFFYFGHSGALVYMEGAAGVAMAAAYAVGSLFFKVQVVILCQLVACF